MSSDARRSVTETHCISPTMPLALPGCPSVTGGVFRSDVPGPVIRVAEIPLLGRTYGVSAPRTYRRPRLYNTLPLHPQLPVVNPIPPGSRRRPVMVSRPDRQKRPAGLAVNPGTHRIAPTGPARPRLRLPRVEVPIGPGGRRRPCCARRGHAIDAVLPGSAATRRDDCRADQALPDRCRRFHNETTGPNTLRICSHLEEQRNGMILAAKPLASSPWQTHIHTSCLPGPLSYGP